MRHPGAGLYLYAFPLAFALQQESRDNRLFMACTIRRLLRRRTAFDDTQAALPHKEADPPEAEAAFAETEAALPEAEAAFPQVEAAFPEAEAAFPEAEAAFAEAEAGLPEAEATLAESEAGFPDAEAAFVEAEAGLPQTEADNGINAHTSNTYSHKPNAGDLS